MSSRRHRHLVGDVTTPTIKFVGVVTSYQFIRLLMSILSDALGYIVILSLSICLPMMNFVRMECLPPLQWNAFCCNWSNTAQILTTIKLTLLFDTIMSQSSNRAHGCTSGRPSMHPYWMICSLGPLLCRKHNCYTRMLPSLNKYNHLRQFPSF